MMNMNQQPMNDPSYDHPSKIPVGKVNFIPADLVGKPLKELEMMKKSVLKEYESIHEEVDNLERQNSSIDPLLLNDRKVKITLLQEYLDQLEGAMMLEREKHMPAPGTFNDEPLTTTIEPARPYLSSVDRVGRTVLDSGLPNFDQIKSDLIRLRTNLLSTELSAEQRAQLLSEIAMFESILDKRDQSLDEHLEGTRTTLSM